MIDLTSFILLGYSFIALILGLVGFIYLISSRIMPYYIKAMGYDDWNEIPNNIQIMSLNLMKGAGVGFLTTAISMFLIVFMSFEFTVNNILYFALFFISSFQLLGMLLRVISVRKNTEAKPPFWPLIILILFSLILYTTTLLFI